MPISPQTPSHSRHTSAADQFSPAERRQSRSSLTDPSTPLRASFGVGEQDISVFGSGGGRATGGGGGGGGGLGNLADELADALSDGEDDEYYEDGDDDGAAGRTPGISLDLQDGEHQPGNGPTRDSGVDVASPKEGSGRGGNMSLKLPPQGGGRGGHHRHRRAGSVYDGSEYGSDSDLDSPGMPPSLVAKMDAVESLARRGTESNGGPTDGVFIRVTEGLRDLGSQAGVEGGATRLITAHTALTSHLTNQARQLQTLSYALFKPMTAPPDPETAEELLPVIASLSESMPRPAQAAYNSLAGLHTATADLVQTLSYLSDTLHMSKQTTMVASRRLKSAKEMVTEMRREEEAREEGERWLARGDWGERLRRRECAAVCGDVVGGFEEVCNSWRARILAQAESTPAPA